MMLSTISITSHVNNKNSSLFPSVALRRKLSRPEASCIHSSSIADSNLIYYYCIMLSRILVASTLLLSMASALDLLIKDVSCESRHIQVHFDYICNGDFLCTFGDVESMEGSFQYYGLVDQENATANDVVIMDANLYFSLTGYTHSQNLISDLAMPLCNDALLADEGNEDGDCPSDGKYIFDTVYNMPQVDSPYMSWAASGWSGELVLEMYLNSTQDLVGKCTMQVQTLVTGSYEEGAFRSMPSAKTVSLAVFGSLMAVLLLCLYCCCTRNKSSSDDSIKEGLLKDNASTTGTSDGTYLM